MSEVREKIIKQLSLGDFISGEKLGLELGISRAAIAKHIEAITDMGLDIYRVTGKGYRLANDLDLLNKDSIDQYLVAQQNDSSALHTNNIDIFGVIDSTNNFLIKKIHSGACEGDVCLAEFQSAGRGRRGRQWISPYGSNLYLSRYCLLEQGMSQAMGLSVVAALAVFCAIKKLYHYEVELKWPNDIYIQGKKLAGILIDLEGQPLEACHCVIGIGLNISMPSHSAKQVDQPWNDLTDITDKKIDRNILVSEIIVQLNQHLYEYRSKGLQPMLSLWHKHDIYFNQPIKIITGNKETYGISRGIDNQGALLIEIDGVISPVYGGEISLRGVQ